MDVEETAARSLAWCAKEKCGIGSSSFSGIQIVEAQVASRDRGLALFVTEQPPYSILVRGIEQDVLPTTQRHGMVTLTHSSLAGGWLSGKWRKDAAPITLIELAIEFVINHPGVTSAIICPRTMEQLVSQQPAADITLSTEVLDRIDDLVSPGGTLDAHANSCGATELLPSARRR